MMRLSSILLVFLAFVVLAPGAAPQETSPKGFVENMIESLLAEEGRTLSIENVSVSLTGDVTVGHVEVSDNEGPWLQLDELSLAWKPLSLFADQLEVTDLSIGRVHMLRMSQSPEGNVSAPQQMQDLQAAHIDRLSIGALRIEESVLGQAVEMKLDGSGEITAAPVLFRVNLTASRLDGKKGDLRIAVDFDPRTRQFQTDLNLSEESDGILAELLALDGEPTVALDLKAAGDFSTWTGDFGLSIDGDRVIEGKARGEPHDQGSTITVDGSGAMAPLLPPSLTQVFAGVLNLSGSAFLPDSGGAAEVDHFTIENDTLRFNLAGTADWTSTRTNLSAEIQSKDPDLALVLPETGSLGKASIAGLSAGFNLSGALASPDWQVSAAWKSLTSNRLTFDRMSAHLSGHGLVPGAQPVTFGGSLEGVLAAGASNDLPPALLGNVSAKLAGTWQEGDVVSLTQADLAVGSITTLRFRDA
jgi:translocation and assembly module TamB